MMRAAPEAKSRSFGIDLWNTRQTTCPSCATGQSPQHEFVRAAAPRRLLRRGPELCSDLALSRCCPASHGGTMLPTRGEQLVRLANGVRLVDGGRRRQCNFLFSDNTPRR
jgi:hypothetical protein